MPPAKVCEHHTEMAVQVGQHEMRLEKIERSVEKIETCVDAMQTTLWKWAGAIAVIVVLATIFGPRIAAKVLGQP